jgi:hypothetical protein
MVQTLTQMKAVIGIMAIVVYSCCCRYRFISQLEYSWVKYQMCSHLSSLKMGLLNPPVITVHCLYSDFAANKWHSEHQRARMVTLENWPRMLCIIWVMIMWRGASSFYQRLDLALADSSVVPIQVHVACPPLNKSWPPTPPPLSAKVSKMPITVKPLL